MSKSLNKYKSNIHKKKKHCFSKSIKHTTKKNKKCKDKKNNRFGSAKEYGVGYVGQTGFPQTFYAPYFGAQIPFQTPDSWWPPLINPNQTDLLGMSAEQSGAPSLVQFPGQMLYTYQ